MDSQQIKNEILRMGFKKYSQFKKKADRLLDNACGRDFTERERTDFLSLPLAVRITAVNSSLL